MNKSGADAHPLRVSELHASTARTRSGSAVVDAAAAWAKAPMHVKAMAGAYVGPLISALCALNDELQALKNAE